MGFFLIHDFDRPALTGEESARASLFGVGESGTSVSSFDDQLNLLKRRTHLLLCSNFSASNEMGESGEVQMRAKSMV